jgi:hypothetical protein
MIEHIIKQHDSRGIVTAVRHLFADGYIGGIAEDLHAVPRRIAVCASFLVNGRQETDGPPGALHLGRCLTALGHDVQFVTNPHCAPMLERETDHAVHVFPMPNDGGDDAFGAELLGELQADCLISIESCGRGADGSYSNMHGENITDLVVHLDSLFVHAQRAGLLTIGVGDGGNEIGFGNIDHPAAAACDVRTSHLIVTTVSNWGVYGLIAQLSRQTGTNFLPTADDEQALIERLVGYGAVDGCTGEGVPIVDGLDMGLYLSVLEELRATFDEG